jgi:hypothetical protein
MSTITATESAQLHEAAKSLYEAMQRTDKALEEMKSVTEPTPEQYHPVKAALSAAAAELTSPQAQCYYIIRAQQDIQTAIVLIIQFGCFAYALGAQCRQWVDEMEQQALNTGCALVLTPVSAPTVYQSSTNSQPSAIAPLKVVSVEPVTPPMLPAIKVAGLLTGAKAIAQPPEPVKLPAHQLSKTELIIQIQQLSPRKVKGVWKMRREALEQLYAAI